MEKTLFSILVLTFSSCILMAQSPEAKLLSGKIVTNVANAEGIYVINLKTEKVTTTDTEGYFTIPGTVGDSLMLSSTLFIARRIAITKEDMDSDLFFVKMKPIMTPLEEVKVFQYKNINAVALGIIPEGQKSYTTAERRLRTATGFDAQIGLKTSLTIDPLLNFVAGRTAMLLKELEVEKKEILLEQIDYLFEKEYFVNVLHIPADYVRGFQYYIVENTRFVAAIKEKNKHMATFLMGMLATKYIDTLPIEKK